MTPDKLEGSASGITGGRSESKAGDELCVAVRNNDHDRIAAMCAAHAAPLRDASGHCALHWAALSGSTSTLRLLLRLTRHDVDSRSEASEQRGQTALHWAVVAGNVENVAALLQAKARPSARDARGYTALVHCAQYGRVDLAHLLLLADPTLIDAADADGRTALHWAAHGGHFGMVSYLTRVSEPRADVNKTDKNGQTPLHKAAARAHAQVVNALLTVGAKHDHEDHSKRTARAVAPAPRMAHQAHAELARAEAGTHSLSPRARIRSYGLVLFYYAVLAVSYWFYVRYIEWLAPRTATYGNALRFLLLLALGMHSYATYGDAGDLTRGTAASCRRDITKALADRAGDTALGPTRYCFTCLRFRPPRSRHSRSRNVCVRRFDHECPWTNNAVGLYNHRALLIFAAAMFGTQSLFLDHLRAALMRDKEVKSFVHVITKRPLALGLFVVHTLLAAFCLVLLLQHMLLAVKGLTTYESMAYKRLGYTRNPHDRGYARNCVDFLTGSGPGSEPDTLLVCEKVEEEAEEQGTLLEEDDAV